MSRIANLRSKAEAAPDDGDTWLKLAEAAFEEGDVRTACRAWSRAYGLYAGPFVDDRHEASYVVHYATKARERDMLRRAGEAYRDALGADHPPPTLPNDVALAFFLSAKRVPGVWIGEEELTSHLAECEERLRGRPRNFGTYDGAATAYMLSGRWEDAARVIGACRGQLGRVGLLGAAEELCKELSALERLATQGRADGWHAPGFEALVERAAFVESEAFSAEELPYVEAGVGPVAARPFIEAGIAPSEAAEWLRVGAAAEAAAAWRAAGFEPLESRGWEHRGLDPEAAAAWRAVGMTPTDADRWREGFTEPAAAAAWRDAGWRPVDARGWSEQGFTPDEAAAWREAGVHARDAAAWRTLGSTPAQAAVARDAGLSPQELTRWTQAGFSSRDAVLHAIDGRSLDEALQLALDLPPPPSRNDGPNALVFWGVPLEEPHDGLDDWVLRLHADRGDVPVETLRCRLGRYGRPAVWSHHYAAVVESERALPMRGGRLDVEPAPEAWQARLDAFCAVLGIEPARGAWHLSASWEE